MPTGNSSAFCWWPPACCPDLFPALFHDSDIQRYPHRFGVTALQLFFSGCLPRRRLCPGTVIIRMALTAPPSFNAALGIGASIYVLVLKSAYNYYAVLQSGTAPALDRQ